MVIVMITFERPPPGPVTLYSVIHKNGLITQMTNRQSQAHVEAQTKVMTDLPRNRSRICAGDSHTLRGRTEYNSRTAKAALLSRRALVNGRSELGRHRRERGSGWGGGRRH